MGTKLALQGAQVASNPGAAQVLTVPTVNLYSLLWISTPRHEMGSNPHNRVGAGGGSIVMTSLSTNTVLLPKYSR